MRNFVLGLRLNEAEKNTLGHLAQRVNRNKCDAMRWLLMQAGRNLNTIDDTFLVITSEVKHDERRKPASA